MSRTSTLGIPQDVLDSARLTVNDLKTELAIGLYAQRRLSVGKARKLAGLSLWEFRQLCATRKISPHYDVGDFNDDLETLRQLNPPS